VVHQAQGRRPWRHWTVRLCCIGPLIRRWMRDDSAIAEKDSGVLESHDFSICRDHTEQVKEIIVLAGTSTSCPLRHRDQKNL